MPKFYLQPGRFLFFPLFVVAAVLSGCANVAPPSGAELGRVQTGNKVLVLFRVVVKVEGQPYEPFTHTWPFQNVGVALGTFGTGGKLHMTHTHWFQSTFADLLQSSEFQMTHTQRFLSEDSRAQGWSYLLVPPGTVYLSLVPYHAHNGAERRSMLNSSERWRVDLREGSRLVYAGTLVAEGKLTVFMFGETQLTSFKRMEIRDERGEAQDLVRWFVPELGPLDVALMQRHTGPIILTTPAD